jgi:tRNA A37 threonylcarbamoyladenosine modification protein TsaB
MILGINAVKNPIEYGVCADNFSQKQIWDGLGDVEQLPKRLKELVGDYSHVSGLFTILGPGNYTGIRLALTSFKMIGQLANVKVVGMSLFDAYLTTHSKNGVTLLTSPSRKGWLNAQLFQVNDELRKPISSLLQLEVKSLNQWFDQFEHSINWGHFGDIDGDFSIVPKPAALDILTAIDTNKDFILDASTGSATVPIYSYPAVS